MKNYIIIGAFDLISHDTIYDVLKKEDNYNAIFIEPVPIHYIKLIENCHKLSGNCYFENTAISDVSEVVDIEYIDEEYLELYPNYINGCSSVVENGEPINIYLKKTDKSHRRSIKIQTITFDYLVKKYNLNNIDYLQIDTEGYDERIVRSIDFNLYNIKKIKFEHHYISDGFYQYLKELYPNYKSEKKDSDIIFKL